jgi:coproporphyrinogen III oxidase
MNVSKKIEKFTENFQALNFASIEKSVFSDNQKEDPIWTFFNESETPLPEAFIKASLYCRNLSYALFKSVEPDENASQKTWSSSKESSLHGGGIMSIVRGDVLEKSCVNMSFVFGDNYPSQEKKYAGKKFAACGVSLISHPKNPFAPIMHLNVRLISAYDDNETFLWMGGGADLTPMHRFHDDTALFHSHLKKSCDKNGYREQYNGFKKNAEEYFYIKHRKEERGVGGIFFDFLNFNFKSDYDFLIDIVQSSLFGYAEILKRRCDTEYSEEDRRKLFLWRGRYVEFNLLYDRGTRFGLASNGNYEAIFCSLPPLVSW